MARVPDLRPEEMSSEQKRIHDAIANRRGGHVRGPFALWMRLPEVADRANALGNTLRVGSGLEKRLFELMVLVIARHWGAQYEWFAHEHQALKAGLASDVIEDLRDGRTPRFARDDEQLIYDVTHQMMTTRRLGQETYDRAQAALGLDLLIEFVASIGFYTMVAITLNAFDGPVPDGSQPLPDLA
ncbi:MAG TPA: carboxymuconolactone decarboxylase family protein [Xanthobacteraceae bacterium]|jgi:4-carboxymuconolactone decarboxylase|nr:carboxymuconolactone decarboxylase family protein [Xanthobacteraceae bacterium]